MDAYQNSLVLEKLQTAQKKNQPLRLAFIDLDGTWAGSSAEEKAVRDLLGKNHYVIGQVTSRTEGLLNPDILISVSGTHLLIKQNDGGYQEDKIYAQRLPKTPEAWHKQVDQLLSQPGISERSYIVHRISPLYCRVEIALDSPAAAEDLIAQLRILDTQSVFHFARETRNFFITPAHTSKEDGVNQVITTLTHTFHVPSHDLHTLFAGDTAVEVPMGFESGANTQAIFLIPGGAPLAHELNLTKNESYARLSEGVYRDPKTARKVIVGDEAFPGTVGPQTLIAWLHQAHP